MSLMPSKKSEYLIDGYFGSLAYCEKCQYAKEFGEIGSIYCRICRKNIENHNELLDILKE